MKWSKLARRDPSFPQLTLAHSSSSFAHTSCYQIHQRNSARNNHFPLRSPTLFKLLLRLVLINTPSVSALTGGESTFASKTGKATLQV